MEQIEKPEEERVECNHSEQNNKIEQTRLDNMEKNIKEIKEALKDTNKTWAEVVQATGQAIELTTRQTRAQELQEEQRKRNIELKQERNHNKTARSHRPNIHIDSKAHTTRHQQVEKWRYTNEDRNRRRSTTTEGNKMNNSLQRTSNTSN